MTVQIRTESNKTLCRPWPLTPSQGSAARVSGSPTWSEADVGPCSQHRSVGPRSSSTEKRLTGWVALDLGLCLPSLAKGSSSPASVPPSSDWDAPCPRFLA